ncbi:PREDICTED: mitochondrial fission regulator 2 [Nanorana parkeri]|uniref:mitochondrial fission regulator 2 n=1 Tax=Nanorana parkeri TaxID=125878 RepID=UPI00085451EF|nr:PREDICTED: mitochondrial fission regulator 2 [Nanorana parkeri]
MSLLLEFIRQLLDYLGIPPDRLVTIWGNYISRRSFLRALTNHLPPVLFQGIDLQDLQLLERKDYGWTRSVVRIIGTLLPLEPCPRTHFQHVLVPEILEPRGKETVCRPEISSLADAPFLMNDDIKSCTRFRHHLSSNMPTGGYNMARRSEKDPGLSMMVQNNSVSENVPLAPSENAIQKIAALEDELMQLRAQIAAIVAMQETRNTHSCSETLSFGSPCNALPPPSLTSTPINTQILLSTPAPPPPPPPPPLPIPPAKINSAKSALDLIKERKASHRQTSPKEVDEAEKGNLNNVPSMLDVLKDMNSIRLRAVERSPGGTPLTRKDKKRRSLNDPAAIIAHALKLKFAHRHKDESLDKENRSYEDSPFSSPETPMFGSHLLKPIGKRPMKEVPRKQVFQ